LASASGTDRLAYEIRKRATSATETYVAYGSTQRLFKECSKHADYTIPTVLDSEGKEPAPKNAAGEDLGVPATKEAQEWYAVLGMEATFNLWAQVTMLHMYVLTTRFRMFPAAHAPSWHQHLLDHFFYAAEDKMATLHGMVARGVRNRYLKDLFVQWRGVLAAYDEGLIRGDAMMAAAVWRNIFKASEEVDAEKVAEIVAYLRREVSNMEKIEDDRIAAAAVQFGESPAVERELVVAESKSMRETFAETQ